MRIIAGESGGRRLTCPAGRGTRPTSDRVRESLFSILGPPKPETRVLDLFAGAGTLGLESLSRGATDAVFIEQDRAALRCLRSNIETLGYQGKSHLIPREAIRELERQPLEPGFDWIFADPPYASDLASRVLAVLSRRPLMRPGGVLIIEHDRRFPPDEAPSPIEKTESRRYGDTVLSLYRSGKGD